MLRRLIREDIELVTVLGNDLGHTKADPGQLEQVIMNLAVNAAMQCQRAAKLTLETANVELDEAYARTHVPTRPVLISCSPLPIMASGWIRNAGADFRTVFTTKEQGRERD